MTDDSNQNKKNPDGSHDASRRRFLKGVGIAGAGAALADSLLIEVEAKEEQAGSGKPVAGNLDVALNINGKRRTAKVEPRTTLLNTLRNNLDPPITGPKLVCDVEPAAPAQSC